MKQKTAAIITSKGIGDGLIMMVASHRLLQEGYLVTTYHNLLYQLSDWFEGHHFKKEPHSYEHELPSYDLIIMQNDNSEKSRYITQLFQQSKIQSLSIFYSSYEKSKHAPLTFWDQVFHPDCPIVENIAKAIATLLQSRHISKNNGITVPKGLTHRKHRKRVIIHPDATTDDRVYTQVKFLKIAAKLKSNGYEPSFSVSPSERLKWLGILQDKYPLPSFLTLKKFAAFVYESGYLIGNDSGPSHLASNLQIPTLVIAGNTKRIRLWRPGWLQGSVITPSPLIPNFKGFRFRERQWQRFISPKRVLSMFNKLAAKN